MTVIRASDTPMRQAPASYFTGTVWMAPIVEPPAPSRLRALHVYFSPGARTHWHTHPIGQTIYVTSGICRAHIEGGETVELREGDSLYFPPNTRHWHGATPDRAMSHIAIQEADEGGSHVVWAEPVSDEAYGA